MTIVEFCPILGKIKMHSGSYVNRGNPCGDIEIIDQASFERIVRNNRTHLDELVRLCNESGELIEGNCFTIHATNGVYASVLVPKQINIFSLARKATNILEVGFNAGHSSLLMLLGNSQSNVLAFDICAHNYTEPCFDYLSEAFPGRIELIRGDSAQTVPAYCESHPNKKFDLIHIDGSHFPSRAERDFYSCYKMTRRGSIVIWDDVHMPDLKNLMFKFLKEGLVVEEKMLETFLYEHAILRVI